MNEEPEMREATDAEALQMHKLSEGVLDLLRQFVLPQMAMNVLVMAAAKIIVFQANSPVDVEKSLTNTIDGLKVNIAALQEALAGKPPS